jgi:hypothetical protein
MAGVEYSVCLDHVLTNLDEVDEFAVLEDDLSDHKALTVLVKAPLPADSSGRMPVLGNAQGAGTFGAPSPSAHAALDTQAETALDTTAVSPVSPCGQMAQSAGALAEALAHVAAHVAAGDIQRGQEAAAPGRSEKAAEVAEASSQAPAPKPPRPTLHI